MQLSSIASVALPLAVLVACAPASAGPAEAPKPTPVVQAPAPPPPAEGQQQIAQLGACSLESGQVIADCRVGYRTFGKLSATKSNVVLVPTWFTGTTADLVSVVPGKLVDTSRDFVVLVDALGDGVSSSPSNSEKQPRLSFPKFTVGDMVQVQKRLLLEVLGVTRLRAVLGISMGGMQAFEWAVREPEMVERVVSIVGTPQLASSDLLLWTAELHALDASAAYRGGAYEGHPPMPALLDIHQFALTTPEHRVAHTSRSEFSAWVAAIEADTRFDWNDWHRQLEAMLAHDVARRDRGSLTEAAKRVRSKVLVVVASHDHMVNPGPASAFAKLTHGELLVLDSQCGHAASACEAERVGNATRAFLSR